MTWSVLAVGVFGGVLGPRQSCGSWGLLGDRCIEPWVLLLWGAGAAVVWIAGLIIVKNGHAPR